jgi:hypothetical protein
MTRIDRRKPQSSDEANEPNKQPSELQSTPAAPLSGLAGRHAAGAPVGELSATLNTSDGRHSHPESRRTQSNRGQRDHR